MSTTDILILTIGGLVSGIMAGLLGIGGNQKTLGAGRKAK